MDSSEDALQEGPHEEENDEAENNSADEEWTREEWAEYFAQSGLADTDHNHVL